MPSAMPLLLLGCIPDLCPLDSAAQEEAVPNHAKGTLFGSLGLENEKAK